MTGSEFRLETGDVEVTLAKVYTPTGERLAVEWRGDVTRLDALDCETLTWQSAAFYTGLVDGEYDYRNVAPKPREDAAFQVGNEYTVVRFRLVEGNAAVEVTAPKLGHGARVDARAFAALVGKPKTFFSELLETPYGPEH